MLVKLEKKVKRLTRKPCRKLYAINIIALTVVWKGEKYCLCVSVVFLRGPKGMTGMLQPGCHKKVLDPESGQALGQLSIWTTISDI